MSGYVEYPNDLLEALGRKKLSGAEWVIFDYIVRQSIGRNRETTAGLASVRQIHRATGLAEGTIKRGIKQLRDYGMVRRTHLGGPRRGANSYAVEPVKNWRHFRSLPDGDQAAPPNEGTT